LRSTIVAVAFNFWSNLEGGSTLSGLSLMRHYLAQVETIAASTAYVLISRSTESVRRRLFYRYNQARSLKKKATLLT